MKQALKLLLVGPTPVREALAKLGESGFRTYSSRENPENIFGEVHYLEPARSDAVDGAVEELYRGYFAHQTSRSALGVSLTYLKLIRRGVRVARRQKCDCVKGNIPGRCGIMAMLIARWTGLPYVLSIHDDMLAARGDDRLLKHPVVGPFLRLLEGLQYRFAARILVYSEYMKKLLLEHYRVSETRIRRTFIAPDLSRFQIPRRPDPDFFTLVYVGNLSAKKNPMCLLLAFEKARSRRPDLRLWLVGDGPERPRLEAYIAVRKLAGVTIHGYLPNDRIPSLMAAADAFVHASRAEGFSNTITEAQVMGLPILSSNAPSKAEMAHEGNALLFEVDNPDHLAERILELSGDDKLRTGLAEASLRTGWRFMASHPERRNAEIFLELLGARNRDQ